MYMPGHYIYKIKDIAHIISNFCERERAFLEPQWASRYVHGFSMSLE